MNPSERFGFEGAAGGCSRVGMKTQSQQRFLVDGISHTVTVVKVDRPYPDDHFAVIQSPSGTRTLNVWKLCMPKYAEAWMQHIVFACKDCPNELPAREMSGVLCPTCRAKWMKEETENPKPLKFKIGGKIWTLKPYKPSKNKKL